MMEELKNLLRELRVILESQGEKNWIRGVQVISNALADDTKSESSRIEEAKRTYGSMNGGAGSFSDYYIHKDDFDERVKANQRLEQIKDRLWELLG